MASVSVEIVSSERGRNALLINDFKFVKHREWKCGKIKWTCERRKKLSCKAKCFTQGKSNLLNVYFLNLFINREILIIYVINVYFFSTSHLDVNSIWVFNNFPLIPLCLYVLF